MASSSLIASLPLLISLSLAVLSVHAKEAGVICEELPQELCAFSISSSGRRCVLETSTSGGATSYMCRTSEVRITNYMSDWVETDECVNACGLDRNTVGISSDALLERDFREKLCSTACYQGCPNIVELYTNLAAGEGASLKELCKEVQGRRERILFDLLPSAGHLAKAPSGSHFIGALAPSAAHAPSPR